MLAWAACSGMILYPKKIFGRFIGVRQAFCDKKHMLEFPRGIEVLEVARKTKGIGVVGAALVIVLGFLPRTALGGIPIPGPWSTDMTLYRSGSMTEYGDMRCGDAYYAVWRSVYNDRNHWLGRAYTDKTGVFCDITDFGAIIAVYNGAYPGSTGSDPYSHLPLNGQTWTYNSKDGFTDADAIGSIPGMYAEWAGLYSTSVPWRGVPWYARQEAYGYYNWHWWSGGGCSGGWDEMRQGLGSTNGHGNYMYFRTSYVNNGCWFGGMNGWAEASVYLSKF